MKKRISLILTLLTFAFPFYIHGDSFKALAIEEEESALEEEDVSTSENIDESESHLKDRKKKKNSKSIHLPTTIIGGGNGKQDFTDVILDLDQKTDTDND